MSGLPVRGLALGALTALLAVAGPATASFATPTVRPDVAAIAASPDSGLADGQAITVTATGYPTNAALDLVECAQDLGCDFSELYVLQSGDSGGYTTTFYAHRYLNLDGVQIDCVAEQNCVLVSLDITDLSTGAQTSITFDPNAPPPPPLRFRLAPNVNGHTDVAKGVARVTGTVHCNQPVTIDVFAELVQVYQRQIFESETEFEVACTRNGRFEAVFRPENGLFGAGDAKLHIDAVGTTDTTYELLKSERVTLVPSS